MSKKKEIEEVSVLDVTPVAAASFMDAVEICRKHKGVCRECKCAQVKDHKSACGIIRSMMSGVILKPAFWNLGKIELDIAKEKE